MKVLLSNVRLSFPDLFTPKQFNGQGPFNYRAQFLVEPGSKEDKAIRDAIKKVAEAKWGAKASAVLKQLEGNPQKFCWIDGDTRDYDGYAGKWALSTTRDQEKGRPTILDRDKSPLAAEDGRPYAGCFVNASVEFWAQENGHGKGLRCTLLGVQFLKDGDSFGGGSVPSADDFDDLGVEDEEDALA